MDTPLYVLSTAASMVENAEMACLHQNSMHTDTDLRMLSSSSVTQQRSSPPYPASHHGNIHSQSERKQYTTLTTSSTLSSRDDRASKKCAGTQTSFTSFAASSSPYHRPRSPRSRACDGVDNNGHTTSGGGGSHSPPPPPPYDYQHQTSFRAHTSSSAASPSFHRNGCYDNSTRRDSEMDMDSNNMPLNLTISSASHQRHSQHSQSQSQSQSAAREAGTMDTYSSTARPSVITRTAPVAMSPGGSPEVLPQPQEDASTASSGTVNRRPNQDANTGDSMSSDPGIEEHFRRSLGTQYSALLSQQNGRPRSTSPSDTNNGAADPQRNNVSITGNVDDHFAKSLGDTWTKLNVKKDDNMTGTVDDHFAKALGDTWFKIKAQKEGAHCTKSSHLASARTFNGSYVAPSSSTIRL